MNYLRRLKKPNIILNVICNLLKNSLRASCIKYSINISNNQIFVYQAEIYPNTELNEESKYAASARAFRDNVTRDLANEELRSNFRGAMDYLMDKANILLQMEGKSLIVDAVLL